MLGAARLGGMKDQPMLRQDAVDALQGEGGKTLEQPRWNGLSLGE
jgi:hypothetical protein